MHYLVKRNAYGDLLFWNPKRKNFSYSGGCGYASLDSAKTAFRAIMDTYNVSPENVEIMSHESVLNFYNKVTSCD
jgi:hypothetical protein